MEAQDSADQVADGVGEQHALWGEGGTLLWTLSVLLSNLTSSPLPSL